MRPYKLIALDMDGTLLNEERQISAENQFWIRKALEHDVTVCISTGRGLRSALPYLEELDLNAPMVTANGGEVWENPQKLLTRHLLNVSWVIRLHQLAEQWNTWYWAYAVDGLYNKDHWTDDPKQKEWLKFGFYTEDDEVRQALYHTIRQWEDLEITNSHPCNLECNPKGVNKASGLQHICKLLDIDMKQVVAVGDSLNDVSMIRAAGLGVAMGNAQDEVKQIADIVTATNDEHGVAKVIQEYVLV